MAIQEACQRCACFLDLKGMSKTQAVKSKVIARTDWHTESDCIRHLANAISAIQEELSGDLNWEENMEAAFPDGR